MDLLSDQTRIGGSQSYFQGKPFTRHIYSGENVISQGRAICISSQAIHGVYADTHDLAANLKVDGTHLTLFTNSKTYLTPVFIHGAGISELFTH